MSESKSYIEYEKRPEEAFDRLNIHLPLPRWMQLPDETRQHLRAARREQLLALRSLVNAAIDRLEKGASSSARQTERSAK